MRFHRTASALLIIVSFVGCAQVRHRWNQISETLQPSSKPSTPKMIAQIERAHGAPAWHTRKALSADISVICNDTPELQGTLTFTTDGRQARIDLAGGTTLVSDGEHVWVAPESADSAKARDRLRMWPFVVAVPFKLRESGAFVTEAGTLPLGGRDREVLRMTMNDAPDDWYILYPDLETGRLRAMAYLVKSDDAPAEPRAIVYDDFVKMEGVQLATRGTLYKWTLDQGITGDPIGRATLKNVQFIDPPEDFFNKPDGAKELPPPATTTTSAPATQP